MKLKIFFTFILAFFLCVKEGFAAEAPAGPEYYVRLQVSSDIAHQIRRAIITQDRHILAGLLDPSRYHLTVRRMRLDAPLPPIGADRERVIKKIKRDLCKQYLVRVDNVPFSIANYSAGFGNFGVLVVEPNTNRDALRGILPERPHVSLIRDDERIRERFNRPTHVDTEKMNAIKVKFNKACLDLAVGNTLACVTPDWCARN